MVFNKWKKGKWSFAAGASVCPLDQHIIDCVKEFPKNKISTFENWQLVYLKETGGRIKFSVRRPVGNDFKIGVGETVKFRVFVYRKGEFKYSSELPMILRKELSAAERVNEEKTSSEVKE
jgi:hypothetical protein